MFLRRNRRTVDGQIYEYWTRVRTVRTAKGPRQEVVASLGKTPGLGQRERHGWEDVADLLEGRSPSPRQGELGQRFTEELEPQWAQVDLRGVSVNQRFKVLCSLRSLAALEGAVGGFRSSWQRPKWLVPVQAEK